MLLVEQLVIDQSDPGSAVIDEAAFQSRNLYNAALYETRQAFMHEGKYLNYTEVQRRMQSHEAYKALPAKVSQQVQVLLERIPLLLYRKGTHTHNSIREKVLSVGAPPAI